MNAANRNKIRQMSNTTAKRCAEHARMTLNDEELVVYGEIMEQIGPMVAALHLGGYRKSWEEALATLNQMAVGCAVADTLDGKQEGGS